MNYNSLMKKLICSIIILPALMSCMTGNQPIYEKHEMVLVEPGSFYMGSDSGNANEKPVHLVRITRPYFIGKYEVTFSQYDAYIIDTEKRTLEPEITDRGNRPAMGMTWIEAVSYCNWLSEKEGLTPCYTIKGPATECDFEADGYRLPTEAEWEFAAIGGNKSEGYLYSGSHNVDEVAWYMDNSNNDFHAVGLKRPNELGIFDMSGNMWEWCWDYWDEDYYADSPDKDPLGPLSIPEQDTRYEIEKSRRSSRWLNPDFYIRVTARSADFINYGGDNGIRLVRTKR